MFSTPRVSAHTKEAIGYIAGSWKTRNVLAEETRKWCMKMGQGGDHEHWIEHISNNMSKEELKEASKLLSKCLCCAKHSGSFGKTWENKTGTLLKPGEGWTRKGLEFQRRCECNCRHHRRFIDKALNMVAAWAMSGRGASVDFVIRNHINKKIIKSSYIFGSKREGFIPFFIDSEMSEKN